VVVSARKAAHLRRDAGRLRRSGQAVAAGAEIDLEQLLDAGPTPAFAAEMMEESQRLLERLGDEELRSVALWKMEGLSNEEIARRLGCGLRSAGRKL
jgi:DNA-directed RNA polymerase specialized sigma24 family protein